MTDSEPFADSHLLRRYAVVLHVPADHRTNRVHRGWRDILDQVALLHHLAR